MCCLYVLLTTHSACRSESMYFDYVTHKCSSLECNAYKVPGNLPYIQTLFQVSNNPSNQVERTFAEIMRCYRQRPLADNHVYRSVLINQTSENGEIYNN